MSSFAWLDFSESDRQKVLDVIDLKRLLGFDNAHPVPHRGGRHVRRKPEADHWHRTSGDKGRPYAFVSVERLLEDFFGEAERVLKDQGVAFEIIDEKWD